MFELADRQLSRATRRTLFRLTALFNNFFGIAIKRYFAWELAEISTLLSSAGPLLSAKKADRTDTLFALEGKPARPKVLGEATGLNCCTKVRRLTCTAQGYTLVKRLRPFERREFKTPRPPRVFMRTKKPWVRLRRITDGWNVRFMVFFLGKAFYYIKLRVGLSNTQAIHCAIAQLKRYNKALKIFTVTTTFYARTLAQLHSKA